MIIQFDTAHNLHASDAFKAPFIAILNDKLERFAKDISRLEVHLSDENGHKEGVNDKRCLLEAHMDRLPHIVATNHADSYEQSVDGAVEKLLASLRVIHERRQNDHKRAKQEEN